MPETFSLIPYVRAPLNVGTVLTGSRRSMSRDLQLRADGTAVGGTFPLQAVLRGPGDVIGIDRAQIARVEPSARLACTEPNYFPFVEFVDPDFPWRYTLDEGTGTRLKPWIVLLALKADEFELMPQGRAPTPSIKVFKREKSLPDLGQSWAHAHAHVSTLPGKDAGATLAADPARGFSRLLCPRKLTERTTYWLFLVPAWKAGVEAGLGERPDPALADQPAWTAPGEVILPFYFKSQFNTDAGEDFESLLRRLRPPSAPVTAAPTKVPCGKPGFYAGYSAPGKTFDQQCALELPGSAAPAFETDESLVDLLVPTLQESIQGDHPSDASGPDPLVTLPAYGFRFPPAKAVSKADVNRSWFDRLNLDLKFRHVAALATEVVAHNQERYAKEAWDQYDELTEANRTLSRLQVAAELTAVLSTKHFSKLQPALALTLAEPLHAFVKVAGQTSIQQLMHASGVPGSSLSRAVRKLAAKRMVQKSVPTPPGTAAPAARTGRALGDIRTETLADLQNKMLPLLQPAGAVELRGMTLARPIQLGVQRMDLAAMNQKILSTLKRLPSAKADFLISGRAAAEKAAVGPISRSPVITDPLADDLKKRFPARLAGFLADDGTQAQPALPNNTVILLQENRAFIEAFMAGANHAMQEELRWREFPTDMRATIFRRFWPSLLPDDHPDADTISAVAKWTKGLGKNGAPQPRLVIGLRGDLVRKYQHLQVVINIAEADKGWQEGKGDDFSAQFAGALGADFSYHGFGLTLKQIKDFAQNRRQAFAVFYEPTGHLRFGLDVGNTDTRERSRDMKRISMSFPIMAAGSTKSTAVRPKGTTNPTGLWADLSSTEIQFLDSGYVNFGPHLQARENKNLWGADKTSASVASALWQKPVAGFVPLGKLVPGV